MNKTSLKNIRLDRNLTVKRLEQMGMDAFTSNVVAVRIICWEGEAPNRMIAEIFETPPSKLLRTFNRERCKFEVDFYNVDFELCTTENGYKHETV